MSSNSSYNPPEFVSCIFNRDKYTKSPLFHTGLIDYNIRIFPLQVSVVCVVIAILQLLLKPLGETLFVAQILGGILIGNAGVFKNKSLTSVLTPTLGGTQMIETFGDFGCMMYIFLVGVKTDLSILTRSSRREKTIGILSFVLPLLFTLPISFLSRWKHYYEFLDLGNITWIALITSTTSFHAITCFLADLKILNTELGRIATSASTISGMCSWVTLLVICAVKENMNGMWVGYTISALAQIVFITVVLQRIVNWMIEKTPESESLSESYLFSIILMVLGTGFLAEWYGQHLFFAPMILGLTIPNGPPIGSALVNKFETLTSGFFVPLYFFNIGVKVWVDIVPSDYWKVLPIFYILGFLGKLLASLIIGYFYGIPFQDGFMLGLCLNTRGILDIQYFRSAITAAIMDTNTFSCMVVASLVSSAVLSPLVHFFYNPSRRFIVYKKHTIQNLKVNSELRILVGIYNDEIVPTIVNILEASNPTTESAIIIYLLHLVELVGRSNPVLIAHKPLEKGFKNPTTSDHIINGFRIYENKNHGVVYLLPFTSITPLSQAHEDICTLALEKRTSFIIIPFHKQWNIDGTTHTCKWRNSNKKILKHAPCSVGILIDRGVLKGPGRSVLSSWSTYTIGIIFLGGADDREALCYGMRMANNQNVYMTVYRLIVSDSMIDDVTEKILDEDLTNEYRRHNTISKHNLYIEKMVRDGVEIISVIQNMETGYDLILVGRNHDNHSTVFSGLQEWNEYPELGFFGDMLASPDFRGNASVLVMQQHCCFPKKIA